MDRSEFTRRLQLNAREYQKLLAQIEPGLSPARRVDRRANQRRDYRHLDIPLLVEHPAGGVARCLVHGRNISERGISVLHGAYLHVGSHCQILVEHTDGDSQLVAGVIIYCRLLTGASHEIGIRFDRFVPLDRVASDPPEVAHVERDAPLEGRVLIFEPFPPDRALLEHALAAHHLELHFASTTSAMIEAVGEREFALVLLGLGMTGDDALGSIRSIRETGFDAPLIVLSSDSNRTHQAAREAGATEVLCKPLQPELLEAELRVHLEPNELPSELYSAVDMQPEMWPLIERYVDFARDAAEDLKLAYNKGAWDALAVQCRRLRGSGCSYGFPQVTATATAAHNALTGDPLSTSTRAALARLIACCRALRTGRDSDSAA